MVADKYIDNEELSNLLEMFNMVITEGYSIKSIATDPQDLNVISTILDCLEEECEKIKAMQSRNQKSESIKR